MRENYLELLNSEGPILTAKKVRIGHEGEIKICLEFPQEDEFVTVSMNEFFDFIEGKFEVQAGNKSWDYLSFSDGMKPGIRHINAFINYRYE